MSLTQPKPRRIATEAQAAVACVVCHRAIGLNSLYAYGLMPPPEGDSVFAHDACWAEVEEDVKDKCYG